MKALTRYQIILLGDAWFPPFRCRSSVAISPFWRCKIPLFYKNYVRKFRSVTAVNSKKIRNGSVNGNGNGVRKRQRLTGTEKRQRKNGNGMVVTRHDRGTFNWCEQLAQSRCLAVHRPGVEPATFRSRPSDVALQGSAQVQYSCNT